MGIGGTTGGNRFEQREAPKAVQPAGGEDGGRAGKGREGERYFLNIFHEEGVFLLTESDSFVMISVMNTTRIQHQIEHLQKQLTALGPMHPGSLGEQYNVCGKAGCRCKDPKHPQKHGPYYQLSFTWRGKSTTRFVRPEHVVDMQRKVANYKRFRELVNEWVDLEVEREKAERAEEKHAGGN